MVFAVARIGKCDKSYDWGIYFVYPRRYADTAPAILLGVTQTIVGELEGSCSYAYQCYGFGFDGEDPWTDDNLDIFKGMVNDKDVKGIFYNRMLYQV